MESRCCAGRRVPPPCAGTEADERTYDVPDELRRQVSGEWVRQWPCEEVWKARKRA
jgi:hypothetical protein